MARRNRLRIAAGVAAAGLLLSVVLRWESARHAITGEASRCAISAAFDCDKVAASDYSRALGLPLSTWGAAYFLLLLLLLLDGRGSGGSRVLAALGLPVAAFLAYVSWFEIGSLCLYCTGMQLCIVAVFALLWGTPWRAGDPRGGLTALVVAALALLGERAVQSRVDLLALDAQPEHGALRLDVSDALVLGDLSTPVSVVIFFDFGCDHCKRCYGKAAELVRRYPSGVHVMLKHWPLDRECNREISKTVHPGACLAARAGTAAARLGKSAEALTYLTGFREFLPPAIDELGRQLGIGREAWDALVEGADTRAVLERDVRDGHRMKFGAVPRVFINGHYVDSDRLVQRVERLLGE